MKQKWKFLKLFLGDSREEGLPSNMFTELHEYLPLLYLLLSVQYLQYKPWFWSVQGPTPGEGVWPVPQTQETKALSAPGECHKFLFFCSFHLNF